MTDTAEWVADDFASNRHENFKVYPTSFGLELSSAEQALQFNNVHDGIHLGIIMAYRPGLKHMVDAYAVDAIYAVQTLKKKHAFWREDKQFLGGHNNRTLTGAWQDQPVVFKFYGNRGGWHLGTPQQRQEIELRILRLLGPRWYLPQTLTHLHDPRSRIQTP